MKKNKKVDTGIYNRNQKKYDALVNTVYRDYPGGVTLPPEYAYFVEKDILRILIRLARYKFVARLLRPTDTVLEVGSGSGLGSIFLSQHCAHVTGLDVKTTEIEESKSVNSRKNVEFVVADFFNLAKDRLYDVIVALDVIEHYPEREAPNLLHQMAKHLKSTGIVVVGTPSFYSYPYQSSFSQASHQKCYTQVELAKLMDTVFGRSLPFSMNDELVHTGNPKMAWYYFMVAMYPKV